MAAPILEDQRIIETVDLLQRRIDDRFPGSGLSSLCSQLLVVARQTSDRSSWIAKPILWIRLVSFLLAGGIVALIAWLVSYAAAERAEAPHLNFIEAIQSVDAGLNVIIFMSVAIVFLFTLERRIKRRRALSAIHELRSLAHVIDMHQLTKDPERSLGTWARTKNSPTSTLTAFQLHRYLDYCSEMLSLTGKIAALYVQRFDDADAVAAVSELEQLSTGLSRKIWQKIMILRQSRDAIEKLDQAKRQSASPAGPQSVDATREAGEIASARDASSVTTSAVVTDPQNQHPGTAVATEGPGSGDGAVPVDDSVHNRSPETNDSKG